MDDQSFTQRKQKILELISQNQWSKACFLIKAIFDEINPIEIEQNSWLLLNWLKCSIHAQDYAQAAEILPLSHKRVTSFNLQQNIQWLELHQELILSVGVKNVKQACELLVIWRKLSPIFASMKYWRQWEKLNSTTFETLLKGSWTELFWEPLLWWLQWSKDFHSLSKPSMEKTLAAFELEPNTWLLDIVQRDLIHFESNTAENINRRIHHRIEKLNYKLSPQTKAFDLSQSINQAILDKDQSKLLNLLERGAAPNGYPNLHGAWWLSLENNTQLNLIECLLLKGAWVNIRNKSGFNALMISTTGNKLKLFKLLIKYGADPLMRTLEGQSLLHLAVKNKNLRLVNELLNLGLSPDLPDLSGITARKIAINLGAKEILRAFKA